ncbi:hypothetical protein AVEN_99938-1 [Araneus ventricosus]|uniref:Uncharacterized protein n=1 Tax=Araneus ventricosus TaxID=182803 RepID=A0A4Y2S0A3_ARAVE|nr:hypothetical protein AVEN_99938-1 [Araneus ventricosus]
MAISQVLQNEFMKVPDCPEEWRKVVNNFLGTWNFPMCPRIGTHAQGTWNFPMCPRIGTHAQGTWNFPMCHWMVSTLALPNLPNQDLRHLPH